MCILMKHNQYYLPIRLKINISNQNLLRVGCRYHVQNVITLLCKTFYSFIDVWQVILHLRYISEDTLMEKFC